MTANDNNHRGLLPAGLADLLPPDAAREARAVDIAIERFAAFGYERVKPPLVEFEELLLGGPGAALAPQTFRLMDPVSQRMMGVRPDMTVQVARIAVTRLKHEPRPLRLSYGGNVIRVRGTALKPERQFAQVGSELIGVDSADADAEAVLLAVDALRAIGVADLSVDLNLPTLVAAVAAGLKLSAETLRRVRRALDRKDEGGIAKALGEGKGDGNKKAADLLVGLLRAAGPAEPGIARLTALKLPAAAAAEAARLAEVVKLVRAADEDLPMTLDPGRVSRPRIPDRRVVLGVRPERPRGAGARRPLFGGLSRGRRQRARDRLHALYGCGPVGVRHGARAAETLSAARNAVERGRPLADQRLCRGARRYGVCRPTDRGEAAALQPRSDRQGSRAALGGRLPLRFGTSSAGRYRRRTAPRRGPG